MQTATPTCHHEKPASRAVDIAALKPVSKGMILRRRQHHRTTILQIVGETLCEALDLRASERMPDVAASNDDTSLAALWRGDGATNCRHRHRPPPVGTGPRARRRRATRA